MTREEEKAFRAAVIALIVLQVVSCLSLAAVLVMAL